MSLLGRKGATRWVVVLHFLISNRERVVELCAANCSALEVTIQLRRLMVLAPRYSNRDGFQTGERLLMLHPSPSVSAKRALDGARGVAALKARVMVPRNTCVHLCGALLTLSSAPGLGKEVILEIMEPVAARSLVTIVVRTDWSGVTVVVVVPAGASRGAAPN